MALQRRLRHFPAQFRRIALDAVAEDMGADAIFLCNPRRRLEHHARRVGKPRLESVQPHVSRLYGLGQYPLGTSIS